MGMSIDKAIAELELLKKNTFSYMSAHQAFITAIDTMRKYQKIKDFVKNNNGFTDGTLEHSKAFTKIVEVVEDGKDII